MCEARQVERADGSRVVLPQTLTWKSEVNGLIDTLKHDAYVILFFPMFFNNSLYWIAEIIGAYVVGYALDAKSVRRSVRAKIAASVLLVLTFAVWGGGYVWQKRRADSIAGIVGEVARKDFTDSGYIGPMFLYLAFGLFAAIWQTCLYWYERHAEFP
jgi:hypothetical protein